MLIRIIIYNKIGTHYLKNVIKNWFFRMFEQRCIALMDSMYNENTKHAIEMMDDEAVVWGIHSSPLTFAYENFMYDIVAHTCSQKNMNKQWYNNLAPDLKPFFLVSNSVKSKLIFMISCYVNYSRQIMFFQFYFNCNTDINLKFKYKIRMWFSLIILDLCMLVLFVYAP